MKPLRAHVQNGENKSKCLTLRTMGVRPRRLLGVKAATLLRGLNGVPCGQYCAVAASQQRLLFGLLINDWAQPCKLSTRYAVLVTIDNCTARQTRRPKFPTQQLESTRFNAGFEVSTAFPPRCLPQIDKDRHISPHTILCMAFRDTALL